MTMPEDSERRANQNPPLNVADVLAQWYLQVSTYAHEARRIDESTAEVVYTVPDIQCDPSRRPNLRGEISVEDAVEKGKPVKVITNQFQIDGDPARQHTEGHFRTDVPSNRRLFPGYMGVGSLIAAARSQYPDAWLTGFRTIAFSQPGLPGDTAVARTAVQAIDQDVLQANGVVTCGGRGHTRIFEARFERGPQTEGEQVLGQHQLFEAGAQFGGGAVRLLLPERFNSDVSPVYASVGRSTLSPTPIRPGDVLRGLASVRNNSVNGVSFDVQITRLQDSAPVAQFGNLTLGFLPTAQLSQALDQLGKSA